MIKILGTGHFLPENVLTNDALSLQLDTSDAWISTRTGIKQRHIAPQGMLNSDMATAALQKALHDSGICSSTLSGIVLATTTPDLLMPATAVRIQQNLGLKSIFAFDIQAACTGFIYALNIAYSMIKAGQAERIAVIGSETMSRIVDWNDRATCVLFGDGAGAVIIGRESESEYDIIGIDMQSDGAYLEILRVNGGISQGNLDAKVEMLGTAVYKFAIESMSESLKRMLEKFNIDKSQLDWIIPHQANDRIIRALSDRLGIPYEKFAVTVDKHANTSAASIPLALAVYAEQGLIRRGDLLALCAVGSGMTWGSALLRF